MMKEHAFHMASSLIQILLVYEKSIVKSNIASNFQNHYIQIQDMVLEEKGTTWKKWILNCSQNNFQRYLMFKHKKSGRLGD